MLSLEYQNIFLVSCCVRVLGNNVCKCCIFNDFAQAIIGALGAERRNRVLSGLYMGRSDTQLVVRQASLHVWKIVVSNTPRTLREILPTLFTLLLGFLASTCPDKRTVQTHIQLQSDFSLSRKRCIYGVWKLVSVRTFTSEL